MEHFRTHFNADAFFEHLAKFSAGMLAGILLFFVFWIVAMIVGGVLEHLAKKATSSKQDVLVLIAQTVKVSIYVIGVISALGTAGVNVSALVASLGLTGFALGFAFKDALSNLLAGAMILFYRPFSRGSRIVINNIEGVVQSIDLRYTTLQDNANSYLIPNSTLLSNIITLRGSAVAPEAKK